jgi:hypothetical protein
LLPFCADLVGHLVKLRADRRSALRRYATAAQDSILPHNPSTVPYRFLAFLVTIHLSVRLLFLVLKPRVG